MNLREEEKNYIDRCLSLGKNKISLRGKNYYIKLNKKNFFLNEKLVERIASKIDLRCVQYALIDINEKEIIISEDLNNYGIFYLARDIYEMGLSNGFVTQSMINLNSTSVSLTQIWNYLDNGKFDSVRLMRDVIKMYLLDVFILNYDRHFLNWGILVTQNSSELYVLDHSEIFEPECLQVHSFIDDSEIDEIFDKINIDENFNKQVEINTTLKDIENFLSVSSSEFVDLFSEIIEIITPEFIAQEMKKIEKKYGCKFDKEKYLEINKYMYFEMKSLLNNNKRKRI